MKKESNLPPQGARRPPAPTPFLCRVFGHRMRFNTDDVAGQQHCTREGCQRRKAGIEWSRAPSASKRTQAVRESQETLQDLEKRIQQLEGNNKGLVIMNAALRSRPDLGDRAPRVIELCEENVRLKKLLGEDP